MSYVSKNLVSEFIDSQGWEHHDHTKKIMKDTIHYLMNRGNIEPRVIFRKGINNAIARLNPDYTPSNLVAALENKGLFKIASCRNKIDYKPLVESLSKFHEEKVLAEAAAQEAAAQEVVAQEVVAQEAAAQEVVARFPALAWKNILIDIATGGLENSLNINAPQARAIVSKYLPKYFVGDKEVSTELASRLRSELGYELVVTYKEQHDGN